MGDSHQTERYMYRETQTIEHHSFETMMENLEEQKQDHWTCLV